MLFLEIKMKWMAILLLSTFAWAGVRGGVVGGIPRTQPAQSIRDLRAVRKGDKVTLTWSWPRELADGTRSLGSTWVCRSISASASPSTSESGCTPVGKVEAGQSAAKLGTNSVAPRFTDTLDDKLEAADPPRFAIYHVELTAADGGGLASSNYASVSLAPAASLKQVNFSLDPIGVYLIWQEVVETDPAGVEFDCRIWRREKGAARKVAVRFLRSVMHEDEGGLWSAVDNTIEWEKSYTYWITPITRVYSPRHELLAEFEGDDAGPIEVTAHDVFAPATPEDLSAVPNEVPTKKFIDLLWRPNTERDLAGYNIYRREEGGSFERIATAPANMLSYQDWKVTAGHKYFYAISAVDLRGNESGKTHEIGEVTPQ